MNLKRKIERKLLQKVRHKKQKQKTKEKNDKIDIRASFETNIIYIVSNKYK